MKSCESADRPSSCWPRFDALDLRAWRSPALTVSSQLFLLLPLLLLPLLLIVPVMKWPFLMSSTAAAGGRDVSWIWCGMGIGSMDCKVSWTLSLSLL